jgi:hypothetical protein
LRGLRRRRQDNEWKGYFISEVYVFKICSFIPYLLAQFIPPYDLCTPPFRQEISGKKINAGFLLTIFSCKSLGRYKY